MHTRFRIHALAASILVCAPASALAHVSVAGPGYAGKNQVLNFGIGHGCEGADTVSLEITIPSDVTSVRAVPNVFGEVEVKTDDTGAVTSVVWTKNTARAADELYYTMSIRARMPEAPFTTLLFPARQTCRTAEEQEIVVDWAATPEEVAAAKEGEEPEPAPALTLLPAHSPGWNKFDAAKDISDLSVFDDAEIVWVGDAAYSSNPTTTELIEDEDDVDVLTKIESGAEIWVKY